MNSETTSTKTHCRVAFAPLKPKRRFKPTDDVAQYKPVLVSATTEIARQRQRFPRSGRPNVQWRRAPSPAQISEVIPARSPSPALARVIDKVKNFQPRERNQGIWSLLRCWALAIR